MLKLTLALALALAASVHAEDDLGMAGDYGDYGMGGYGGDPYGDPYGGYGGGYGDDYGGYGGGEPAGPAFEMIDDVEGVQKFLDDEATEAAVIGFFNDDTNKEDIEVFEAVAQSMQYSVRFAYSVEDDVREANKAAKSGCVVHVYLPPRFVSEKYDKPKARFPGKTLKEDALSKFISKKVLPLVGQKNWKANELYDSTKLPVVTLFTAVDLEKNPKGFDYYSNRLRRVAVDMKDKLVFNIGDKEDFSYTLDDYGLELPNKKDVGVGIKDGNKYYAMTDTFSVENLRTFCEAVLNGEVEAKVKEEPDYSSTDYGSGDDEEEDDDTDSAVVKLTNDNVGEVLSGDKDVMVEFYAPWCGHCQQLKPTYKKLAAKFEGVETVTVAAMDATANDIPDGYDVQGYPTIYFSPANGEPKPYEGARDLDSMAEHIMSNAAIAINDEL